MKMNHCSVMGDVPVQESFYFNDPYHGFNNIGTRSRITSTIPTTVTNDLHNDRRSQARERVIPIQVEGRQWAPSPKYIVDLTDSVESNTNNNGYGQDGRRPPRHSPSGSHGDRQPSSSHSSRQPPSSNSNRQAPFSRRQPSVNSRQNPIHTYEAPSSSSSSSSSQDWMLQRGEQTHARSGRLKEAEVNLCPELIDMCMYEDFYNSQEDYATRSYKRSSRDSSSSSSLEAAGTSFKSGSGTVERRKSRMTNGGCNITPTPSYPVYAHLKRQLHKDGHQVDYIRGDGNCFFRALSKEVYGTEEFHDDVRQAVVDLMEKYPTEFEQFMDTGTRVSEHIKDMRRTSTWASSAEIYAAATLLQRDIYVLSPDHSGNNYNWMLFKVLFTYTSEMSYHPCFIMMCHTHGNHYDRITPESRQCNCDCEPPSLSGVQAYVDLTNTDSEVV